MPEQWLSDVSSQGSLLTGALPAEAVLGAILTAAALAGVLLWLAGRILLKPAIVLLLALVGGATGASAAPLVAGDTAAPVAAGAGLGLTLGALLGLVLFRFAMAVALGAVLAVATPLIAAIPLGMPAGAEGAWAAIGSISEGSGRTAGATAAGGPRTSDPAVEPITDPLAEESRNPLAGSVSAAEWVARAAYSALDSEWSELSAGDRAIMALSAMVGAVLGVGVGLILPVWAAGIVSALLGPAVWLPCVVWGARATGLIPAEPLVGGPAGWLMIWAGLAAVGLAVQCGGLIGRRTAK